MGNNIRGIKHPQQNDLISTKLTCCIFSREIYKIWPENRKTHPWRFYTVDNSPDHISQIAPFISALLFPETVSHHIFFTLKSLSTYCTWSLCCRCVSHSAVVDRRDPKLVGNGRGQSPNGVTPGLRVLDDAAIPNRWADPLRSPLPWSVAAVPPSRSLWQPNVLQKETCQTSSLLVLHLPLQVHLIPLPAVVRHTDQRCVWWHRVSWWGVHQMYFERVV